MTRIFFYYYYLCVFAFFNFRCICLSACERKTPKKRLEWWKCEASHGTWHCVCPMSLVLNVQKWEIDWFLSCCYWKLRRWAQRKSRDQIVCRVCLRISYWPTGVKETWAEQRPSLDPNDWQTSALRVCTVYIVIIFFTTFCLFYFLWFR